MIDASSTLVLSNAAAAARGRGGDNLLVWIAAAAFIVAGIVFFVEVPRRLPFVLLSVGLACLAIATAHPFYVG